MNNKCWRIVYQFLRFEFGVSPRNNYCSISLSAVVVLVYVVEYDEYPHILVRAKHLRLAGNDSGWNAGGNSNDNDYINNKDDYSNSDNYNDYNNNFNPNSNSNNSNSFNNTNNNSYNDSYGGGYFDDDDGGPDDGTPACEHGKRCVKLTARTGDNAGREFYKCSLPRDGGEQCDFFEWLDGEVRKQNAALYDFAA